jgi:hypothetical protein
MIEKKNVCNFLNKNVKKRNYLSHNVLSCQASFVGNYFLYSTQKIGKTTQLPPKCRGLHPCTPKNFRGMHELVLSPIRYADKENRDTFCS